ncbi:MAG TPA: hypothetical protein DEV81_23630 [Cyanobacteria bacterium UBA11049]|nr:hypothetical protein [Cyanobacteria bacterium UBA11049]
MSRWFILKLVFTDRVFQMQALLTEPIQVLTYLITGYSQRQIAIGIRQSMTSKHNCPCCSNTLLRHIRLGGLYWRCSRCYQEMPV